MVSGRASRIALCAACMLAAPLGIARAQRGVNLVVDIGECSDIERAQMERHVRAETELAIVATPDAGTAAQVQVQCRGDLVEIDVRDRATAKRLSRRVSVARVQRVARTALVALAIVELLEASWIELTLREHGALEPVEDPARAEVRAAARSALHCEDCAYTTFFAGAALLGRAHVDGFYGYGARALAQLDSGWLALALDLAWWQAMRETPLGHVRLRSLDLAPSAGLALRYGSAVYRVVAGVRAGFAQLQGDAELSGVRDARVEGLWWGPLIGALARWRLAGDFGLALDLEAGWVLRPVVGFVDGSDTVTLRGLWVAGSLGVTHAW